MPLTVGSRIGQYDVVALLGAGGMGEVYRAKDTKLGRDVALKILPASFANDPERVARFRREAQALASLNHPHIAQIYGLEESDGTQFLVLELVDGESLDKRIARGPIPVDEALAIAKQLAEALEAAHEKGIIHRDLKPANIALTNDSQVKVLDFGLAKAVESTSGSVDAMNSPTITSPAMMTGIGVILGTAAYMSPEQAKGRAADKRSDIWAFGCVLYEMLAGKRPFDGEDVSDTLAAVLRSEPDWSVLPPTTPRSIRTLLRRCLGKVRRNRLADAADARLEIEDVMASPELTLGGTPAAVARGTPPWHWAVPTVLASLLVGGGAMRLVSRTATENRPVMHVSLELQPAERVADMMPSSVSPRPELSRTAMALTPDGRGVIFAGAKGSLTQLFVRRLDQPLATPIVGTEGAVGPFLSPDGQWIGFWADGKVKKVPLAGGPPISICDALSAVGLFGATWGSHDTIVFSVTFGRNMTSGVGLMKVPAAGGTPQPLTTPDAGNKELRHLLPAWLPDERAILYTVATTADLSSGARIVAQTIASGERHVVVEDATDPRYLPSGHLLYMKLGVLMAAPFDATKLQVTGPAVAVLDGVMQALNAPNEATETGAGQFAVSTSGTLVYIGGGIFRDLNRQLVLVDRHGTEAPLKEPPASVLAPRISPDGQRVLYARRRAASRVMDTRIYDLRRDTSVRLGQDERGQAVWSPDGQRVFATRRSDAATGQVVLSVDGRTLEEINTPPSLFPSSWSSGGNLVILGSTSGAWVVPMDGVRQAHIAVEERTARWPVLSDDGRWIAYGSNESGRSEIYVQPFPGPGEKVRISQEGGTEPVWSHSGELFYLQGPALASDSAVAVMAVTVGTNPGFTAGKPTMLFSGNYVRTIPIRNFDVSPDGQHFVMVKPVMEAQLPITTMSLVVNWTEELKARVLTK